MDRDNHVYSWGRNNWGQLGSGKDMLRQISCGFNHTLALTFNGHVYGWGFNASGQVGAGRARVVATPTRIRFPGKYMIEKVIGYENTSFAITRDGRVFIWGAIRLFTPSYTPTLINLDDVTFIKDICFNGFIVYMLSTDGNIYVYFDGAFEKSKDNPLWLLNDLVFDEIRQINSYEGKDRSETRPIIAGITGDTVYHLFRSRYEIIETKCKTFDEFYANELQMTVTAIAVNGCQRNVDPKDVKYIMIETKHLIRIRSEFVIQYYYSWVENNCLYFQMELCFENLAKVLQIRQNSFGGQNKDAMTTRFECYIALEIFRELLECVQYLHENHIIHRDLRPDNVLIAMNGTKTQRYVKLCDFGLSKEAFSTSGPHPMSAVPHTEDVGDPRYQAPEAMGDDYNHKIDIYSLALIGIDIFEFNRKFFMNGKDQLYTAYDTDLADLMTSIYGILLEMSANENSKSGPTDWTTRPECSDILLRFNRLSVGAVIKENDVKLFDECIESNQCRAYVKFGDSCDTIMVRPAHQTILCENHILNKMLKLIRIYGKE
ncbi:unnamed protein product [Oppiella nova]|uniref:Protein kinase domain-containing protein n=1 Tax=Oppiella nova TaxID=334625 RepID=A0A7R9MA80_9ACAR|nr:unnamed protein product [Oppiella nova]CAG2172358.1 unnamed protein product [Oppiella nova]